MSAIILGWDPARWNQWNYAAVVEQVAVTGLHLEPWGVTRAVAAGTDAWLLLLGAHGPGLIGHGVVLSEQLPEHQEPAANQDAPTITVQVAFDALLPLGDQVPAHVLLEALPGVPWDRLGQGAELAPGDEAGVRCALGRLRPGART